MAGRARPTWPVAGSGWANWSGLATQLANIEKAFAGKVNRVFVTLGLHQPRRVFATLKAE